MTSAYNKVDLENENINIKSTKFPDRRPNKILLIVIISIVVLTVAIIVSIFLVNNQRRIKSCDFIKRGNDQVTYPQHKAFQIRNAYLFFGNGQVLQNGCMNVVNGRISDIGGCGNVKATQDMDIINVNGAIVTPGLVDMHSHIGVNGWPDTFGNQDTNEMTNPVFPQVRAIDAYDPWDPAINYTVLGGVTTSQILPGSGNVVGGQGLQVKMKGTSIEDARIKNGPIAIKMACGENNKRVYGRKNETPMSRMGATWVLRDLLEKARLLIEQQNRWCNNLSDSRPAPTDLSLETATQILRGNVVLNIHCYKAFDMEMMVRVAKEFNIKIQSFHHASEAWRIPKILKENNITIAMFVDHMYFKMESYEGSFYQAKILNDGGVNFAIKSDHPVLHSGKLLHYAKKLLVYGVSPQTILTSVTSAPANAIGLLHRVGTLEKNKDADFVVWDRHPLQLGARPMKVFIEGEMLVNQNYTLQTDKMDIKIPQWIMSTSPVNFCDSESSVLFGIFNATIRNNNTVISNGNVIIRNGSIECIGPAGTCTNPDVPFFNANGGTLIPSIIHVGTLGLADVTSETDGFDGTASGDANSVFKIKAIDGAKLSSRHVLAGISSGIGVSFATPFVSGLIGGQSSAFYLIGNSTIINNSSRINDAISLNFRIGNNVKGSGGLSASVSGQILLIKNFLNNENNDTFISRVVSGAVPAVFWTHSADVIASVLRIKESFPTLHIIIVGGAEAHLVAQQLALTQTDVILHPPYCVQDRFEKLRCSDDRFKILNDNRVNVGLSVPDTSAETPSLRWDAAIHLNYVDYNTVLNSITSTIANMYKLPELGTITVGRPANLALFSDDPLSLSYTELVVSGINFRCRPQPYD